MLKLRPYKKGDAQVIANWVTDENMFRLWSADTYPSYPLSVQMMEELHESMLEEEGVYPMTAVDESGIVGYLTVRYWNQTGAEVLFCCVIIHPDMRGKGYGKGMIALAKTFAFQVLRAEKIHLRVFEQNEAARKCYGDMDFEETGKELPPYQCTIAGEEMTWKRIDLEAVAKKAEGSTENATEMIRNVATGLYNHKGFVECLENNKQIGFFDGKQLLLLCIDIDGLEHINNIYGHSEGNLALLNLARMIDVSLTNQQVCGHLGGNEFGVAFAVEKGEEEKVVEHFIHTIRGLLATYNQVSGKEYSVVINYEYFSQSIEADTDIQQLMEEAIRYKRITKNDKDISTNGARMSKEYFKPEEEMMMKNIIDSNNFEYAFQPIIDVKTAEIYAYEALMRTKAGPKVSPLTLLMYADMHDRLYDIEKATFSNVLEKMDRFHEELQGKKVFVNSIPGHQLTDKDYGKLQEKYQYLYNDMVVEVTEQTELGDNDLEMMLERSAQDHFGIAIDDFGTGYSNTSSLLRYLPNCVKIDRLLITNIQEEPKKQHFVKSIIEFGHDNGILVLAEGVETHAELKAVINMGVDLIQGYYTAKPSVKLIKDIDEKIKNDVLSAKMSGESHLTRKVFMVDKDGELPLIRLALEEYTGLLIADQNVTLVGNPDYRAGVTIKIKDGAKAKLTLRNVFLEGAQDLPCIDIGKGAELTLIVERDNALYNLGIRVPEESSLRINGAGNLAIHANGLNCYGIGNVKEAAIGSIYSTATGTLDINVEGNNCYAIGGGVYRQGKGIRIYGGSWNLKVAGETSVGIGCTDGDVPIDISHCRLDIDFKIYSGSAIGTINGIQNIRFSSVAVQLKGSGSQLCGIGSTGKAGGLITMHAGKLIATMNGQNVKLLGGTSGGLLFEAESAGIQFAGEGSKVAAIGCDDQSGRIHAKSVTFVVTIHAGDYFMFGAKEEDLKLEGCEQIVHINED